MSEVAVQADWTPWPASGHEEVQGEHAVEPADDEKLNPAVQSRHSDSEVAPEVARNLPAEQAVQLAPSIHWPAGHVSVPVLQEVPEPSPTSPAGQVSQAVLVPSKKYSCLPVPPQQTFVVLLRQRATAGEVQAVVVPQEAHPDWLALGQLPAGQ